MHWELSEEQDLFVASLREWLQERADFSVVRGWLDAGDHTHFERLLVEEGWAGVGFDESIGGQGATNGMADENPARSGSEFRVYFGSQFFIEKFLK